MELKLNIYENKQVSKTYVTESYEMMFGTVEDVLNLIDVDKLQTGSDTEIIQLVGNIVKRGINVFKPLLKDIFEGLTDDELRNTRISEIASVIVDVVKYAISQMSLGAKGKN